MDNICYILTSNFLNEVRNIRYENGISSSILGNMDETLLFFNMPITKTIVKKGSRQVIVKTQNQEKVRISVILTILADSSKLAPLVILKAQERSIVYNQLQKDEHVLKKIAMSNVIQMLGLLLLLSKDGLIIYGTSIWIQKIY